MIKAVSSYSIYLLSFRGVVCLSRSIHTHSLTELSKSNEFNNLQKCDSPIVNMIFIYFYFCCFI